MKSKICNLIKAVVFILIFFIGLNFLYQIFRWKDTSGSYESSFDSLKTLKQNTVEVLFLGPSRTYSSMNPATFWDDYGIASFNMSVSGQDKNSTIACLKEVLKTQRPKVVLVDASGTLFEHHAVRSNLYRNTIGMKLSVNNYEHIKKAVEKEEQMPFLLRWPIVHTRYTELQKYDFVQNMPSVYLMGYSYGFNSTPRQEITDTSEMGETTPISETNSAWINELIDFSNRYGFELAFFLTPGATEGKEAEDAIIRGVTAYLQEKNIDFLNFNTEPYIEEMDYATDFGDSNHVNYFGATKVQGFIGEYLSNTFPLQDCRGKEGYEAWELSSKYKEHILTDLSIRQESDPGMMVEAALDSEDYIMVFSVEGDIAMCETDVFGVLDVCGVADLYDTGGTCVIEDGKVTFYSADEGSYKVKVNDSDSLCVSRISTDEGLYTQVFIGENNYREYDFPFTCFYVVIYDKFTDKVVCTRYFQ